MKNKIKANQMNSSCAENKMKSTTSRRGRVRIIEILRSKEAGVRMRRRRKRRKRRVKTMREKKEKDDERL